MLLSIDDIEKELAAYCHMKISRDKIIEIPGEDNKKVYSTRLENFILLIILYKDGSYEITHVDY